MGEKKIESVAVLGAGTMGTGIAAACAQAGCEVLLLDVTAELAEKGKRNMVAGRMPMLDDPAALERVSCGSFDEALHLTTQADWICEAIIENLEEKRKIFARLGEHRGPDSIVSTNTSGIPLRAISENLPQGLRTHIAVTHFFNPVKFMKLLEVVPGDDTTSDVVEALSHFCSSRLGKGIVHAKDTVNFIGNRIGCFWMLAGLQRGGEAQAKGVSVEQIDALMTTGLGIPPTGLYGLLDLVGLDVMELVAKNLNQNLPANDVGRAYTQLPAREREMLATGQLGRKTGGGYYRMLVHDDGSKTKQMFSLNDGDWVDVSGIRGSADVDVEWVVTRDDDEGRFAWSLISETLCYAADLVPEISDDIVNIDRAMRWGFNWKRGPFELLDAMGIDAVVERLNAEDRPLPRMIKVLLASDEATFYSSDGACYLGLDGKFHDVPN